MVFDICEHVNEPVFFFGTSQRVNSTPHRAHLTHANIFSRVAHGSEQASARFICVRFKTSIHRSHVSSLTRSCCGLTSHHFLSRSTFPLCCIPSHSDEQPLDPRIEGRSGRLAVESLLAGCEPNATVDISSAEVTPILLPSRRGSFCPVFHSGEHVTIALTMRPETNSNDFGVFGID